MLIINYGADEFSIKNVIQSNILMKTDFIIMMIKYLFTVCDHYKVM